MDGDSLGLCSFAVDLADEGFAELGKVPSLHPSAIMYGAEFTRR